MPYVRPEQRERLKQRDAKPQSAGELNYLLTKLILEYWARSNSYQCIAEITGALENAKQEFYRRVATPYEEAKRDSNGEVY